MRRRMAKKHKYVDFVVSFAAVTYFDVQFGPRPRSIECTSANRLMIIREFLANTKTYCIADKLLFIRVFIDETGQNHAKVFFCLCSQ